MQRRFTASSIAKTGAKRERRVLTMSHASSQSADVSLEPSEGWHCSHLYYRFDRAGLARLGAAEIRAGREQFSAALDPQAGEAPARLQSSLVSGHKADFGLMLLDANPL